MGKQRRLRELRSLLRIKLALTAESLRAGEGFAEQMGKEVDEANDRYRVAKGRTSRLELDTQEMGFNKVYSGKGSDVAKPDGWPDVGEYVLPNVKPGVLAGLPSRDPSLPPPSSEEIIAVAEKIWAHSAPRPTDNYLGVDRSVEVTLWEQVDESKDMDDAALQWLVDHQK